MTTTAQTEAARINGAKSHGPVTAAGKAASSRNAIRHGILSNRLIFEEDEIAVAEGVRYSYARRFQPEDQLEVEIIEGLVMLQIKFRRLDRLEAETMARSFEDAGTNESEYDAKRPADNRPSLGTLGRYRGRLEQERSRLLAYLDRLITTRPEPAPAEDEAAFETCTNEPETGVDQDFCDLDGFDTNEPRNLSEPQFDPIPISAAPSRSLTASDPVHAMIQDHLAASA